MSHGASSTAKAAPTTWGVMAEFATPGALMRACEGVRDAGYKKWDCYTPIPVHGIDESMGLRVSRVSRFTLGGALVGVTGGFMLQYWTAAIDYQIVVAGKPFGAWEPFTPVTFELGILCASIATLLGMLTLNVLPQWWHPLFKKPRFLKVSDDRFVLAIQARDPKFDATRTRDLLERLGGTHIEEVEA